jgi:hypothetical protein
MINLGTGIEQKKSEIILLWWEGVYLADLVFSICWSWFTTEETSAFGQN